MRLGYAFLAGYVATIVGANWAIRTFGNVEVGFGLSAPAGVFFAGLAFTFRDLTQESLGRCWTVAAIAAGGLLSFVLSDGRIPGAPMSIALASALAFTLSEGADYAVYTPLRRRGWVIAVGASNAVGFTVDSILFLALATGSLDLLVGQLVGKAYMTGAAIAIRATYGAVRGHDDDLLIRSSWPHAAESGDRIHVDAADA